MPTKKQSKIKTILEIEELIAGLRRKGGHLPTLLSEAAAKKKRGNK